MLRRTVEALKARLNKLVSQAFPGEANEVPLPMEGSAHAPLFHFDSYACNPEPFSGSLDCGRSLLLQCRIVFSQSSRFLSTKASSVC